MTAALEGGEWSSERPGRTLPPGKSRYPFYRRVGGPQSRYGRAENLVPTGIRSRGVQPVAQSLYRRSYPAHTQNIISGNKCNPLATTLRCAHTKHNIPLTTTLRCAHTQNIISRSQPHYAVHTQNIISRSQPHYAVHTQLT